LYFQRIIVYKRKRIKTFLFPINHPDLTASYHNIASVYQTMGNHSEALPFYEKTREILEKTLPPYHVRLATVYNSIAFAYYHMEEYPNALLHLFGIQLKRFVQKTTAYI